MTSSSNNYPKDYQEALPQIYKRLFRVLAHVYHHHLDVFSLYGHDFLVFYEQEERANVEYNLHSILLFW